MTEYSHAVAQFGMASSDRITALRDHIADIQKRESEYGPDGYVFRLLTEPMSEKLRQYKGSTA